MVGLQLGSAGLSLQVILITGGLQLGSMGFSIQNLSTVGVKLTLVMNLPDGSEYSSI